MAHPSESSKFDGYQVPNLDMKEFTECLEHLAVFDHNFIGPLFTWSNKVKDLWHGSWIEC